MTAAASAAQAVTVVLSNPTDLISRAPLPSTRSDRKSTRLNSSHLVISYAVFCLKKKNNISSDTVKAWLLDHYFSSVTLSSPGYLTTQRSLHFLLRYHIVCCS